LNWAARPPFLFGFLLLALVGWALQQQKAHRAQWTALFSPAVWSRLMPGWDPKARMRKLAFWGLGVFFLLLGLARPQWGAREESVRTTGLDLMLVLDLSRSMDVEDVVPSRIKKARHWIRTLLQAMQGDRVGVVGFAASSYVASPLTNDLNYVQEVLDVLSPGTLGNQGTDIGLGLETALASLDRGAEVADSPEAQKALSSRVILLITDGEDHEGEAQRAAARYKERGVRVFVLGVGSDRGGPIPIRDDQGQLQGYKRQGQETITSRLDSKTLEAIADAAGGRYWTATDGEAEVEEFSKELGLIDRTQSAERKILIPYERFQIFVAIGLALILLEGWLPLSGQRRAVLGLIVLILSSAPGCKKELQSYLDNLQGLKAYKQEDLETAKKKFSESKSNDPSRVQPLFNQGVAELKSGAAQEALKTFESATLESKREGDPWLSGVSLYNQGSAHEKAGQYGEAIRAFAEAIRMARIAGDEQLELDARKRIEALQQKRNQQCQNEKKDKPQPQNGGQGQSGQQQDQQQTKQQAKGQENKPEQKPYEDPSVSRKRAFKSEKLSPEDSERVMNELSNREKELQARLKKQRGQKSSGNGKDW
jgi:tetratricopeptide (TPR) repeat protein